MTDDATIEFKRTTIDAALVTSGATEDEKDKIAAIDDSTLDDYSRLEIVTLLRTECGWRFGPATKFAGQFKAKRQASPGESLSTLSPSPHHESTHFIEWDNWILGWMKGWREAKAMSPAIGAALGPGRTRGGSIKTKAE